MEGRSYTSTKLLIGALLCAVLPSVLPAQVGSENRRFMEGKKHILFLGGSKYYAHDAVSKAAFTMAKLGEQTGQWDVMFRTDFRLVTKQTFKEYLNAKNLNYFDAIFLFTQGEFPLTDEQKADLLSFVKEDGKGVLVAHSGMDFNRWQFDDAGKMTIKDDGGWLDLIDMLGGVFISHPWRQKVRINVEDQSFPATRHFPKTLEIEDEIYQLGPQYSRDRVRVLVSLDVGSVDLKHPPLATVERKDLDFPLVWVKTYGKGRVFVSPLGHIMSHWDREDMKTMWLEAARWVLKLEDGDATPRPRLAN
jgi:uncharacterized protein